MTAAVLLVVAFTTSTPSRAQSPVPTNLEQYQALALQCLADVPASEEALVLEAPARLPYLRTALTDAWLSDGRAVYLPDALPDTTAARLLPRLQYRVEDAAVAYERAPGKRLRRTVNLTLAHTFTAPDGRLLAEARCTEALVDTVARGDFERLATAAYGETQAPLPPAGWVRRYVEPALLTAATAIGVYLFFSLRSAPDSE